MTHEYDDIIHLPHHQSTRHPHMSMHDRAAQFAPFAALTGHSAALEETARQTEAETELDENGREELDRRLAWLRNMLHTSPEACITWFEPDGRKAGGAYRTCTCRISKVDDYRQELVTEGGQAIPVRHIVALEGEIFNEITE